MENMQSAFNAVKFRENHNGVKYDRMLESGVQYDEKDTQNAERRCSDLAVESLDAVRSMLVTTGL